MFSDDASSAFKGSVPATVIDHGDDTWMRVFCPCFYANNDESFDRIDKDS